MGWENKDKLNITAGAKDPAAMKVKAGYSREDVIKAMGTPDILKVDPNDLKTLQYMVYGKTVYNFDDIE